jgi:hypothetical protein
VIETILSEGRSLGIHLILLFHNFAQVQKANPALLESVLTKARTKFVGGHLTDTNLQVLTSELFITEWHPHIIRDQLYALEAEPCEETRIIRTRSRALSHDAGVSYPYSETEGTSESYTSGTSSGAGVSAHAQQGRSLERSQTDNVATGMARTTMDGVSETEMDVESSMSGTSRMNGVMTAHGAGTNAAEGASVAMTWDPYNPVAMMPNAMVSSRTAVEGESSNDVDAANSSEGEFEMGGYSHARGTTLSHGEAETLSSVVTHGASISAGENTSFGLTLSESTGSSESSTTGSNQAVSRGVTPSYSRGETITESETVSPFMAVKKRWRVASREFLSLQDFLTTKLIKLKSQARAHWAVQPPEGKTIFFRALLVKALPGGRERLPEFLARVLSKPYYTRLDEARVADADGQSQQKLLHAAATTRPFMTEE